MREYHELTWEEQVAVKEAGLLFLREHATYVAKLIVESGEQNSYSPAGSDLYRPELWRAPHWRWFLSTIQK